MKYEEYLEKRQNLTQEAENLINEGKFDEANEKMEEVKALDEKWDKVTEAQANLRALGNDQRVYDVQNLSGGMTGETVARTVSLAPKAMETEGEQLYASEKYKNAWAKQMMGKPMTAEETDVVNMVNAYTHTTENTGIVIPKTVANRNLGHD